MKIIEGMKKIKDLQKKADDLVSKIKNYCVHANCETPTYADQKGQIDTWLQSYEDILKEILKLRYSINKTNINTQVTIELGGKPVTKSITEWIYRRKDLANKSILAWQALTDKGLKEGQFKDTQGNLLDIKIVRCYDPKKRDDMIELYRSEPSIIDSTLEVINAVTDLI